MIDYRVTLVYNNGTANTFSFDDYEDALDYWDATDFTNDDYLYAVLVAFDPDTGKPSYKRQYHR